MVGVKDWLREHGISRAKVRWFITRRIAFDWFMTPYLTQPQRKVLVESGDPIRYGTVLLSLEQIVKSQIRGSLAECGVYKGSLSKFVHNMLPDRTLFLFDTFQGFDRRDPHTHGDNRFRDTSEERVLRNVGDTQNVIIRKGCFPDTSIGLEQERFAFVIIDFDYYEPTLAALKFFYPRVNSGGFIFVHDYNNEESDWACYRALNGFLADKLEKPICVPDGWGSALFRKI